MCFLMPLIGRREAGQTASRDVETVGRSAGAPPAARLPPPAADD